MRLGFISIVCTALLELAPGCSKDEPATNMADAAATSKETGGQGGASSAGGATSTGGQTPIDCPADAGAEPCRECLAANCCDAYAACVKDVACSAALESYRECVRNAVGGSAKGACLSAFSRRLIDAGPSANLGSAIGQCVYQHCIACGAPSI